jgi:hypothetical protein
MDKCCTRHDIPEPSLPSLGILFLHTATSSVSPTSGSSGYVTRTWGPSDGLWGSLRSLSSFVTRPCSLLFGLCLHLSSALHTFQRPQSHSLCYATYLPICISLPAPANLRIINWFLMTPSIATKPQYVNSPFFLFFLLTHYMFRPLRAILRWDIQLDVSKDYSFYKGSAVCTQLDVCLYWYFDLWSPIHVTKLSIKVVKTLIFTVKLVS